MKRPEDRLHAPRGRGPALAAPDPRPATRDIGEPLTAKGRETRQRIIEAAAHLMHVRGVSCTSLEEILEVAAAGKGQFYHYFESRAALEAAVLDYHVVCQPEAGSSGLRFATWADLENWFAAAYRLQEVTGFKGGCPLGSMASEVADRDDALRSKLDTAFALKRDHLAAGLAELLHAGVLREDASPAELAEFVIATIQGGLILARVRREGGPLRVAMDHALAHLGSFRN